MKTTKETLNLLTTEEKISLLCGGSNMATRAIPDKLVPPLRMSDGPHGIRKVVEDSGFSLGDPLPTTSFPTESNMGNTWSPELIYFVGKALGVEAKNNEIDVLLGPGLNIKRNPRCGRNFEYFSEDPILTYTLASSYIKGVQSENVLATPKHFACNSNENHRYTGDSIVDERALREIYLRAFELTIKDAKPACIMTSYNKINGEQASENYHLQNEILRKEWGFNGISMSDWGGNKSRDLALIAGQDLEMPGCIQENQEMIYNAFTEGRITASQIDESAMRILNAIEKTKDNKAHTFNDYNRHTELALKVALESMVLLKNDNLSLPLKKDEKLLVVGDFFKRPRYGGCGSSITNPVVFTTPESAFEKRAIQYGYARGFVDSDGYPNRAMEEEVIDASREYDTIVYFGGVTDHVESEGFDRPSMHLALNQTFLIDALARLHKIGKKVIFVLYSGSSIEMPFKDDFDAILFAGLPGEMGGEAVTRLLYGEECPSGHLTETWVKDFNDSITSSYFDKTPIEPYKESVFVGYRYYDSCGVEVNYPFGYGLSYASFTYSDVRVYCSKGLVSVLFKVRNDSDYKAYAVPQVYAGKNASSLPRPKKELKAYAKILLEPHSEKEIEINFPVEYLEVFDVNTNKFVLEDGSYEIMLGENVSNIIATSQIEVHGQQIMRNNDPLLEDYFDYTKIKDISIESFEALLEIKNRLNKPIIFSVINDVKCEFIVEDEKVLHKYVMKEADFLEDEKINLENK